MALLETATEYILGILAENEEVKKFNKEFLEESVKWVKSWFLKPEDPVTSTILSDKTQLEAVKKSVIDAKLKSLSSDDNFMKELEAKLQVYSAQKSPIKNVLDHVDIKTKTDIHIGDKTVSSNDNFVEKNVVKGGKIETEGGFHLGDG